MCHGHALLSRILNSGEFTFTFTYLQKEDYQFKGCFSSRGGVIPPSGIVPTNMGRGKSARFHGPKNRGAESGMGKAAEKDLVQMFDFIKSQS
jgi:hypothetical protein